MSASITETLYEWMLRRRIMTEVAREMGVNVNTLAGELRPSNPQAKLGADELTPLFAAVRRVGYGHELRGILHGFIRDLKGENDLTWADEREFVPNALMLSKCVGLLCDSASKLDQIEDEAELARMRSMIRSELLSVAVRMEAIVDSRLTKLRRNRRRGLVPGISASPKVSEA